MRADSKDTKPSSGTMKKRIRGKKLYATGVPHPAVFSKSVLPVIRVESLLGSQSDSVFLHPHTFLVTG